MNSASARLPCWLSKGYLKRGSLDIFLTTFSESVISKLQNLWASSFSPNCSKFHLYFKNAVKNSQKVLCFSNHCIWIFVVKLCLLKTRYFSSATNVWTSSPKIWHVNKRDVFQLNLFGSDQWISKTCCDIDVSSAWAPLLCCLSKNSIKRGFLHIYLTTFSESVIWKLQSLWRLYFLSKMFKIPSTFQIFSKKFRKGFFFLR